MSHLFAFLLLFGTIFIVQCDRDTRQAEQDDQYQTERDITVEEKTGATMAQPLKEQLMNN